MKFTKLIASLAAITTVVSAIAPAIMTPSVRADSEENMAAYEWLYDIEATTKATFDQFAFESNVTREQAAKFLSVAAVELGLDSDSDQECDYNDLDGADASLTDYIVDACNMGLFLAQANFNPKAPFLRNQAELVIARMLYGMDAVNDYAMDNDMTEFAAAKEMLMDAGVVTVDVNGQSQVKRGHLALMLYRLVDMDMVDQDDDVPVVIDTGSTNTGEVVEVKNGSLELSLGAQSPANNSSIPYNGVATFAQINFAAGNADVNVHSVTLLRQGLGDTNDFDRVYFEKNGVRISSRATVATDGVVTISFSPSMVVKAGSTMSLDLVASMDGSAAGSEHRFAVTAVNSSAQSSVFNVTTPTLRTANYTVGSVSVETGGQATSIQGSETNYEIGRFRLTNTSANDKEVDLRAITLRNAGNGDLMDGLMNITLSKNSTVVSTEAIINGRDITFVIAPGTKLTSSENALFYIKADTRAVENDAGDTYQFQFKNTEDLNMVESVTKFRVTVTGFTSNLNLPTYTVNGGDVMMARTPGTSSLTTVSPGASNVVIAKGTITARQAVTLEDLAFAGTASSAFSGLVTRMTLKIGNTTSIFNPVNAGTSVSDTFDGAFTVNGTVPFEITADIKSSFSGSATFSLATIDVTDFSRIEYMNGNTVAADQKIGTISTVNVTVQASNLSVSRNDGLSNRSVVRGSTDLVVLGAVLSTTTNAPITINSIDFATGTAGMSVFNNKVSLTLYVNGVQKQTKQFNGSTLTFSSLAFNVANGAPVTVQLKANVNNDVLLEGEDMSFNLQNINATDSNSQTITAPAAVNGVVFTIAGAGTTNVTANASSTDQGFAVAGTMKKVGSFAVQAINDDLEVRGAYINLSGVAGYTNAGNIMTSFVVKDAAGNVVANETARSGTNSEIVKFDNFVAGTRVNAGNSKTFSVFANVGALNSSTDGGEFVAKIATTYTDTAFSGQIYSGMRLYSVNAGTYVTAGTVTTSSVGNTLNVVSAYPVVSKVADGNATNLLTFKVTNAGSTNLLLSGVTYFANAQVSGDVEKDFELYDGSTLLTTGTIIAGSNQVVPLTTPLSIAAGDNVTLTMKLTTPFVNTATNPTVGNRVFQISNVNYAQMFANGSTSAYANVSASYLTTVGLPVAAANH